MSDISIYGYTDIGGRKENEDSGDIRIYGKNLVAVIADGLGGQGEGKTASETAVSRLLACGSKEGFPGTKEVSRAFCAANEAILKKQLNQFHMKTTAVYLCICKNQAIWGHVGDSRLYHFQDGELCHYTLDHSLSQMAVALGEIECKDIPEHPQRSRLLRALGCEGEEAEVHEPVTLGKGRHAFLLCTDGFWEYFSDEEIGEVLDISATAEEWLTKLHGRLKKRCGSENDNNTATAVILEV